MPDANFRFAAHFAAASSLAFGAGGFSNKSRTRRLSRGESDMFGFLDDIHGGFQAMLPDEIRRRCSGAAARKRTAFAGRNPQRHAVVAFSAIWAWRFPSYVLLQIVQDTRGRSSLYALIAYRTI